MKTDTRIVRLIFLLIALGFGVDTSAQTITEYIEYTVTIKNDDAGEEEWYKENIAPSGRRPWLKQTLEDAESGKLTVHGPLDRDFERPPLTTEEVKRQLYRTDTIYIENPDPPYDIQQTIVTEEPDIALIEMIRFREKWVWHKKKGLIKEVVAFAPMMASLDPSTGQLRGWMPLFWVKP